MITIVDITIYVGLLSKHMVKTRRHWQSFFFPILSQSMKTHTKRLISSLLGQTSTRNQFFCFLFFQFLNISISWNPSMWISLFFVIHFVWSRTCQLRLLDMLGSSLIGKCAIHFLAFDVKFLKMLLAEINLIFIFFSRKG